MPVKIVLVGPEEPMNVGAVARAMKNFGLWDLALVNPGPRVGPPFPEEAYWLAVHAEDVLQRAKVYSDLKEAVAEAELVVATTGRPRELYPAPLGTPKEVAEEVLRVRGEVALVFGRERIGLTNEELDLAHLIGCIPTHPAQPSLNLAQAVVIFAYELFQAQVHPPRQEEVLAKAEALERFFEDLGRYILEIGFTDQNRFPYAMRRLRRIFHKAKLSPGEVRMLRGLLRQSHYAAQGGFRKGEKDGN